MNNLYVISKADRLSPVDEMELNGDKIELPVIEEPILRDLADPVTKKSTERRYHKRFQLNKNAFALIRSIAAGPLKIVGKSMGSIACEVFNAQPARLGIIDNISMGGLSFQYTDNNIQLNNGFVLDILVADCGFYLANMPFETITDVVIPEDVPGDPIEMCQVRLQFQKLNIDQRSYLEDFILNHGAENGDLSVNE